MKLFDLFGTGALRTPWPTAIDGQVLQSDLSAPIFCSRHCEKRTCIEGNGTLLGVSCQHNFVYFQAQVAGATLVCYGTTGTGGAGTLSPSISRPYKDDLKGRTLTSTRFQQWITTTRNLLTYFEAEQEQLTSKALEPLHETPKLATKIMNTSYALIQKSPGDTFDQKFANSSEELKNIFKSAELLVDSFDMLSIFFNPASARFGSPTRIEPYRLMDKLSRIMDGQYSENVGGRVRLVFNGQTRRAYELYASFKVIPLTILDNAIKYTFTDTVTINISDEQLGTVISIESTGPFIPNEERERIFERSCRGHFAQQLHRKGMGVGLFVAAEAAKANVMRITVTSRQKGYEVKGIPVADNIFSFTVRDVPQMTQPRGKRN